MTKVEFLVLMMMMMMMMKGEGHQKGSKERYSKGLFDDIAVKHGRLPPHTKCDNDNDDNDYDNESENCDY